MKSNYFLIIPLLCAMLFSFQYHDQLIHWFEYYATLFLNNRFGNALMEIIKNISGLKLNQPYWLAYALTRLLIFGTALAVVAMVIGNKKKFLIGLGILSAIILVGIILNLLSEWFNNPMLSDMASELLDNIVSPFACVLLIPMLQLLQTEPHKS